MYPVQFCRCGSRADHSFRPMPVQDGGAFIKRSAGGDDIVNQQDPLFLYRNLSREAVNPLDVFTPLGFIQKMLLRMAVTLSQA